MSKRRYANGRGSFGKGLLTFLIVVLLAVGAGYGLTEYVITPYFLGGDKEEPQENELTQQGFEGSSIIIDQQNVNTEGEETGAPVAETPLPQPQATETGTTPATNVFYCIQYGSFSDQIGAETVASSLAASEIAVTIMQKDGAYKLIGTPYFTKEEAVSSMEKVKAVAGNDIFITTVEVRMQ